MFNIVSSPIYSCLSHQQSSSSTRSLSLIGYWRQMTFFVIKNHGKLAFSSIFQLKIDVLLCLIFYLELWQLSATLQLNQEPFSVWVLKREDLFLLQNQGKLAFSSIFQLKTEVHLGLISHLELYQPSATFQLNQKSVFL